MIVLIFTSPEGNRLSDQAAKPAAIVRFLLAMEEVIPKCSTFSNLEK